MSQAPLPENDLWLLNYYRASEINGALFFGRIARIVRGPLQVDVTHHFADEANHARYWTQCISDLGHTPTRQMSGYQDQYLEAAGMPVNMMEVMAITHVFEKRVISQYSHHLRAAAQPRVRQTIEMIMRDERWHVKYVREALQEMAARYGDDRVSQTLDRYTAADQEVYAKTLAEYGERVAFLAPADHSPEPMKSERQGALCETGCECRPSGPARAVGAGHTGNNLSGFSHSANFCIRHKESRYPMVTVTFDRVAERISAMLSIPMEKLTPLTTLDELAVDSFRLVETVVDLQEEFDSTFTQAELKQVTNIGELVELLRSQK